MRRLKPQEKRPGAFRMLRALPMDLNLARFKKFVARLEHRLYWDQALRKIKLKNRRRRAAARHARAS